MPGLQRFNTQEQQKLRKVVIRALQLEFTDTNPDSVLSRYHDANDLARIEILCHELIISAPLKLPRASVLVRATIARLEGESCIDTTPVAYTKRASNGVDNEGYPVDSKNLRMKAGEDGLKGEDAGDTASQTTNREENPAVQGGIGRAHGVALHETDRRTRTGPQKL